MIIRANILNCLFTPFFLAKQRKIRFEDDDSYNPEESEKDTRPKFKPAVSPLQVRMLQMAGQVIPMVAVQVQFIFYAYIFLSIFYSNVSIKERNASMHDPRLIQD